MFATLLSRLVACIPLKPYSVRATRWFVANTGYIDSFFVKLSLKEFTISHVFFIAFFATKGMIMIEGGRRA